MEIRTYLAILWRRKWVIAVTVCVTVIVALIGTLIMTPKYEAQAKLRVLTAISGSSDWVEHNIVYADRLMNTYAEIAVSRPVLDEMKRRLGLEEAPKVRVENLANTELMQIIVEDSNPELAMETANTLAEILVEQSAKLYSGEGRTANEILDDQLTQLEQELNQARKDYEKMMEEHPDEPALLASARRSIDLKEETYTMLLERYEDVRLTDTIRSNQLSIVEPAVVPTTPSKPNRNLNAALGFIVGLFSGLGLAFLFENMDTTLYTTGQIETVTGLSTLGKIPGNKKNSRDTFVNGVESFRCLRTNILMLNGKPLKTLMVASAEPKEGKSTVVANLAVSLAQSGRSVVVVDCDLRLPTLHTIFDMPNDNGFSNVLTGESTLQEATQVSRLHDELYLLPSGPPPGNPSELLGSSRMLKIIEQLAGQFDMVLLDTPSVLAVTDAALLAPLVEGVLLVVGRTRAREGAVRAACRQLGDVKAKLVGVVVNRAENHDLYHYYHRASKN